MQTAEPRKRDDLAPLSRWGSLTGRLFRQTEMGSVLVVVAGIFGNEALQVKFVEGVPRQNSKRVRKCAHARL
jgi:hypothetical protein